MQAARKQDTLYTLAQHTITLTEAQKASYHTNGYLIVDNVFTPQDCDFLMSVFEKHANKEFSSILNLDREEPMIRAALKYPPVVHILETLESSPLWGLMTFFLFKRAGSPYASQAWNPHQDNSYPETIPCAYVTANIPFEDQDRENGGMYVYPGSHKDGLFQYEERTGHREEIGTNPGNLVKVPEKYKDKKIDIPMKKGSCLVLNGNILHGSYPNVSKTRSRPMLLMTYVRKGVKFRPGTTAARKEVELHD